MKKLIILSVFLVFAVNTSVPQNLFKGVGAGVVAGILVKVARNNALPSLDKVKLHARTGICREQLTGATEMALTILTLYLSQDKSDINKKTLYSELSGAYIGIQLANVILKIVANSN